jgi:tetratricopeptide (TPR) repeat protein
MSTHNLNYFSRVFKSLVGTARRVVRSLGATHCQHQLGWLTLPTGKRRFRRNSPTLLILCALSATLSPLYADDFQAGIDAYHASEYAQAADAFEQALTAEESAAARHNLALSKFQQGNPAKAAWQLERAARLDPLNESYLYKLGAVRQQLGLYEQPVKWWQAASRVLPQSTWIWIVTISTWILLATLLLSRIAGFTLPIALKLFISVTSLSLFLSAAALVILQTQQASGIVVSSDSVTLHYAPASAAPEAGMARPGERARIVDQHNDFLKIETEAQITGWIEASQFRKL